MGGVVSMILQAAAVLVAPSPTCAQLAADFEENEYVWGITHDLNQSLLDGAQRYAETVGEIEHLSDRGGVLKAQEDAKAARRTLVDDDDKYAVKADRITTLLIANKCNPPDRVASWFTFSKTNPSRREFKRETGG